MYKNYANSPEHLQTTVQTALQKKQMEVGSQLVSRDIALPGKGDPGDRVLVQEGSPVHIVPCP